VAGHETGDNYYERGAQDAGEELISERGSLMLSMKHRRRRGNTDFGFSILNFGLGAMKNVQTSFLPGFSDNLKSKIKNLKLVITVVVIAAATVTHAGESARWQADWEKTLQAAKKEGQLTLYGSADYEILFADFNKNTPISRLSVSTAGARMLQNGSWRSGAVKSIWPISTSTA
jgi:hypothetical protein